MLGLLLTGLVLVFPLDLEDVEEVGRRCVHLDHVLVILGRRIGDVCDLQLLGALKTVVSFKGAS